MRALALHNRDDTGAGLIGERAVELGFELRHCTRELSAEWPSLDGVDLVMPLGSIWSVYWDDVAKPVGRELALLREAYRRGIPIFGICFGAQIVSAALGGSVQRAKRSEIGWMEVETDQPEVIAPGPWLEYHHDTFTVPSCATELARSEAGPQSYVARRTLAVQFHPEVTPEIVDEWLAAGADEELRSLELDPEALVADTLRHAPAARDGARALFDHFCERIAG